MLKAGELCQRAGSPLPKCLCSTYGRKLCFLPSFLCNSLHSCLFLGVWRDVPNSSWVLKRKYCAGTRQGEAAWYFAVTGCTCAKQTVSDNKPPQVHNVWVQTKGNLCLLVHELPVIQDLINLLSMLSLKWHHNKLHKPVTWAMLGMHCLLSSLVCLNTLSYSPPFLLY